MGTRFLQSGDRTHRRVLPDVMRGTGLLPRRLEASHTQLSTTSPRRLSRLRDVVRHAPSYLCTRWRSGAYGIANGEPRPAVSTADAFPPQFLREFLAAGHGQPVQDGRTAFLWPPRRCSCPASLSQWYVGQTDVVDHGIREAWLIKSTLTGPPPSSTLFKHEFSLADRVALVSGGNRGLGLEMALALLEAGARAVYCVDLAKEPSAEWQKVREYAAQLTDKAGEGRLEYISANVTDQVRACNLCEVGDEILTWVLTAGGHVEDRAGHW